MAEAVKKMNKVMIIIVNEKGGIPCPMNYDQAEK